MVEHMYDWPENYPYYVSPLPDGLADMPPGPELAAALAEVDHATLNGYDLVVVLQARQRQIAHDQAGFYDALSELTYTVPGDSDGAALRYSHENVFASDELRPALTLTRRSAEYETGFAVALRRRLPQVWRFLERGWIDIHKARVLTDGVAGVNETDARVLVASVIEDAPQLTTGQLRARLKRATTIHDPELTKQRYEEGLAGRRVVVEEDLSGTASLRGLQLDPADVLRIRKRIERLSRRLNTKDEPRTLEQIRADVFMDLLLGRNHAEGVVGDTAIDIRIDLETLAGLNEHPGEIPGWGPVIADIARHITETNPKAQWRTTITDPVTGDVIHTGITRRRPTPPLRRHIEATHPTCVFPGCRTPARACDIDHRKPWFHHGPTNEWNNEPLCRHDHIAKSTWWRLRRKHNGDYHWTSPCGHTYTTPGHPP